MKGEKHRRKVAREAGKSIHDIAEAEAEKAYRAGGDFFRTYTETFARVAKEYADQLVPPKEEPVPNYMYRYTTDDTGLPLRECPVCQHDLTEDTGIEIEFFDDGIGNWTEDSCLLKDGTMVDPHGHVADGKHSQTKCGACGIQLTAVAQEDCITKETVT